MPDLAEQKRLKEQAEREHLAECRRRSKKLQTMIFRARAKPVGQSYEKFHQNWIKELEALLDRSNKGELVRIPGEDS